MEKVTGQAQASRAAGKLPQAGRAAWDVLCGPVSSRTWLAAASLVSSALLGTFFLILVALALLASGLLAGIVTVGLVTFAGTLRLCARLARVDRRRIRRLAGVHIEPAPLPETSPGLSFRERQRAWVHSPPLRRLIVYQLVRPPVAGGVIFAVVAWVWAAVVLFVLAVHPEGPITFIGWQVPRLTPGPGGTAASLLGGVALFFSIPLVLRAGCALDAAVASGLLGPSPSQLSSQVSRLTRARALALEAAETERRRIERDLHDGFQPTLVSLALQVGLARTRFDLDRDSARELIGQAHEQAKSALGELRALVRGIHPSVLDERGLDAALSALVAGCPVPVRLDVTLARRPDPASEAIAYFVVSEAVTNITKHSGAARASVTINGSSGSLHVVVEDDGHGGAVAHSGGGLAGLTARVAASDGTLAVSSPPGGPTRVEAVIPCAQ